MAARSTPLATCLGCDDNCQNFKPRDNSSQKIIMSTWKSPSQQTSKYTQRILPFVKVAIRSEEIKIAHKDKDYALIRAKSGCFQEINADVLGLYLRCAERSPVLVTCYFQLGLHSALGLKTSLFLLDTKSLISTVTSKEQSIHSSNNTIPKIYKDHSVCQRKKIENCKASSRWWGAKHKSPGWS